MMVSKNIPCCILLHKQTYKPEFLKHTQLSVFNGFYFFEFLGDGSGKNGIKRSSRDMKTGIDKFSPNDCVWDVILFFFHVQGQNVLVAEELVFLDAPLAGRMVGGISCFLTHMTNIRNLLTGCHFVGKKKTSRCMERLII